jgi:DNA-binding PadR family transcriptional regulator
MGRPDRDPESFLPLTAPVLHILFVLGQGRLHPYGIMQEITRLTGGKATILPGTLYTSIARMLEDGLIADTDPPRDSTDERRRYYQVTRLGKRVAAAEAARLDALLDLARAQGFARKSP